jgi:hypothetical protein
MFQLGCSSGGTIIRQLLVASGEEITGLSLFHYGLRLNGTAAL